MTKEMSGHTSPPSCALCKATVKYIYICNCFSSASLCSGKVILDFSKVLSTKIGKRQKKPFKMKMRLSLGC